MGKEKYADIIIDISHEALDRAFQYRVPLSLWHEVRPGTRVIVPFGNGNREREGYVIAVGETPNIEKSRIKEILRVDESALTVEAQLLKMAVFLQEHYGGTMIKALKTVMPVKEKMRRQNEEVTVRLLLSEAEAERLLLEWESRHRTARVRLLRCLLEKKTVSKKEAQAASKLPLSELKKLAAQGILALESRGAFRKLFPDFEKKEGKLPLNAEQQAVVDAVAGDYAAGKRKTYLLHGVTGSGKTEVYLALIERVLADGKQAIVLIPEIALTYQTVRRFYERFGERIAVINSRMAKGERVSACERVRQGEADVVIGPRSALFVPAQNLGLIIIDEEHDGAYKSDITPKYHARETAIYRASLANASVLLGSATPSVESFARAKSGEYALLTLTKRAGAALLPVTRIIDLRAEFQAGNRSMFGSALREAIEERLERKEQVMLFLNRRGFAGFVSCRACGTVIKCPHCDVSLTYHRGGRLACHYCGYETAFLKQCPVCKSPHVAAFGLGTEKVEAALHQEFPAASVLRMDADTTRKKHAHEEILAKFSRGEADILLGTQMIVKGHDYANVTLVGILAADLSLNEQDFRSSETTFALLCQAAGRAGRGEKPGEVIIQTYQPDHYAIVTAANHDYEGFFCQEYAYRKLMEYPPCTHILVVLAQSGDESQSVLAMHRIEKMVQNSQQGLSDPVQILNPGKASLAKLRDVYRQVLYLKHEDASRLLDLKKRLEPVLESHPLFAGIAVQFDFDPLHRY